MKHEVTQTLLGYELDAAGRIAAAYFRRVSQKRSGVGDVYGACCANAHAGRIENIPREYRDSFSPSVEDEQLEILAGLAESRRAHRAGGTN